VSALAALAFWGLHLSPAAAAAALTARADRRLRDRLPSRVLAAVRALWALGTLALLAAPLLTTYALRTTTGRWTAPAPGPEAFAVAGWLALGGVGLLLVGGALAALAGRRAAPA
jgi:hypothetical protein